jgi:hypothetical protein
MTSNSKTNVLIANSTSQNIFEYAFRVPMVLKNILEYTDQDTCKTAGVTTSKIRKSWSLIDVEIKTHCTEKEYTLDHIYKGLKHGVSEHVLQGSIREFIPYQYGVLHGLHTLYIRASPYPSRKPLSHMYIYGHKVSIADTNSVIKADDLLHYDKLKDDHINYNIDIDKLLDMWLYPCDIKKIMNNMKLMSYNTGITPEMILLTKKLIQYDTAGKIEPAKPEFSIDSQGGFHHDMVLRINIGVESPPGPKLTMTEWFDILWAEMKTAVIAM